jgi:hypothetical protein
MFLSMERDGIRAGVVLPSGCFTRLPNLSAPLDVKLVFALHQTTVIAARSDVAKTDVARHQTEQRDARSDQYRHMGNHQSPDQAGRQKSLNGDAAVYIRMFAQSNRAPRGALDSHALRVWPSIQPSLLRSRWL